MHPLYPKETFRSLKFLVFYGMLLMSFSSLFPRIFFPLCSLSAPLLKKGWIWQFFSCPFITDGCKPLGTFLLQWACVGAFGRALLIRHGENYFLTLLSGAAVSAPLLALPFMEEAHHSFFGLSPLLFALSISWAFSNRGAQTQIFSWIPCKGSWLIFGALSINLLFHFGMGNLSEVASRLASAVFAYLYARSFQTPHQIKGVRKIYGMNPH